jgi:hypothetical protein
LGSPHRTNLLDFPVGPWCRFMPLWGNPLLRLEAPLLQRPPEYQQLVLSQAQAHKAGLPDPSTDDGKYAHQEWDWQMDSRHEGGWGRIRCFPQTANIQHLQWLVTRLDRAKDAGRPLQQAVRSPEEEQAIREGRAVQPPPWNYEQRQLIYDCTTLRLMAKSLLECVPRTWRDTPWQGQPEAAMATHALTLLVRSIGWDAASVAALPKGLRTAQGRAAATAACSSKPEAWVPAAFQLQPRLQLFSEPLPLTIRLATRMQQGPWRTAVQDMHVRCIKAAMQLDTARRDDGDGEQQQQAAPPQQEVQQLLQQLRPRLKSVWKIHWSNTFKETWWRLLLEGVQAAGGHGIAVNGPCPCGWAAPANLDAPTRAAAQRDHVFWHCAPAAAVRRALAHNLPPEVQLQAKHLWLLQPPCEAVHPEVWVVVGLAALTVMASARKHMWALHMRRQEEGEDDGQRQGGGRRARHNRNQAPAQPTVAPHIAATRRAVARLVDGVRDFVDLGQVPPAWVGVVQENHAFIGVRSRPSPTNPGTDMHEIVYTMSIPDDLIA